MKDKKRNLLATAPVLFCGFPLLALPFFMSTSYANTTDNAVVSVDTTMPLQFNLDFLHGSDLDLNFLNSTGDAIMPGPYLVNVYINEQFMQTINVNFENRNGSVNPCIPLEVLIQAGLKEGVIQDTAPDSCVYLNEAIPGATTHFDLSTLQLKSTIPSINLRRSSNSAPPSQWTYGINAAFVNYYLNHYRNTGGSNPFSRTANKSTFATLNSGVNLGAWRFRSQASYSSTARRKFDTNNTYIERALPQLRSEMKIGQLSTSGSLFDSFAFRGFKISSDERMLPEEMRGYSPLIIGIAQTNALVRVMQNGVIITEVTVPPGQFVLSDIRPLYSSSELQVEVVEADGSIARFSVANTTASRALRPGTSHYSFSVGETHEIDSHNTVFEEFIFKYGVNNHLTLNLGAQISNSDYLSAAVGAIIPTQLGTFTFDVARSYLSKRNLDERGSMYRVNFNKSFYDLGTMFSTTYTYYPNEHYYSLIDTLRAENGTMRSRDRHQRIEAQLSQRLFGNGVIYGNAIFENTHHNNKFDSSYQLGYSSQYRMISYNVLFTQQKYRNTGTHNRTISVNTSIPLGTSYYRPTISAGVNYNSTTKKSTALLSARGSLDEDRTWGYYVGTSRDLNRDQHTSFNASLSKASEIGTAGVSYSTSQNNAQFSANVQGAAVFHAGGITLGQYMGDTFGIVEAKYAKGARLNNGTNSRINRFGYAVIPYLTPYSYNRITLNPETLDNLNVELKQTEQYIAPYAGAIAKVSFATTKGTTLLLSFQDGSGTIIPPMGAVVYDETGVDVGMVGQGQQAYARAPNDKGYFMIRWGNEANQQCRYSYTIPAVEDNDYMIPVLGSCIAQYDTVD